MKRTVAPEMKFEPVTASVVGELVVEKDDGLTDVTVGTGLTTLMLTGPPVPPPGAWLKTVRLRVPVVVVSELLIVALIVVAVVAPWVTPVVLPSHCTTDDALNPLPVIVNVGLVPRITVVGETEAIAGTVLLTVNGMPVEVPPPGTGFNTEMLDPKTLVKKDDPAMAVSVVELTNVVGRLFVPNLTWDVETNPDPVTVSVIAGEPISAEDGEIADTIGAGLFTFTVTEAEVPPPGGAL